jgi:hypothetical protein
METATIIVIFVSSLLLGLLFYLWLWDQRQKLRDPFEEHELKEIKPIKWFYFLIISVFPEKYGEENYH